VVAEMKRPNITIAGVLMPPLRLEPRRNSDIPVNSSSRLKQQVLTITERNQHPRSGHLAARLHTVQADVQRK
jgi:hypothetical protein